MAEDGLVTLTASEAAAEIARGAFSAETYAGACLARHGQRLPTQDAQIDVVDGAHVKGRAPQDPLLHGQVRAQAFHPKHRFAQAGTQLASGVVTARQNA